MNKNIAILGSTGSIGQNALQVISALGPEYSVFALSARDSTDLLARQIRQFKPKYAALANEQKAAELTEKVGNTDCRLLFGQESLENIAALDEIDILLTAVVGAAGLPAVMKAAQNGKILAIANKEPLVIAGKLLTETARQNNAKILPVDSEHSAIFQSLQAGRIEEVKRLILTASGGPFREKTPQELKNVTLKDALAHPTWDMGPKITIDSATMMNKALEIIEARWLFDIPTNKIDVLIHPQSVIHSMVEFVDGSVISQMGTPDMKVPIQYALTYPQRLPGIAESLKLADLGQLTFEKPNLEIFRSIELAYQVADGSPGAAVVFNAANEVAVEEFIAGNISFNRIPELIEHSLSTYNVEDCNTLEELMELDKITRRKVLDIL